MSDEHTEASVGPGDDETPPADAGPSPSDQATMSDTAPRPTETDRPGHDQETTGDREVSLRLDGLTKVYDDGEESVLAVDDVSLDIYDGEFIVLVGPSGCGKTTTLRTIAGLEAPTEGRILIGGRDVSGLEPRERDVAMVFQNYALYPHKTVRENLAFPLEVRKYPRDEVAERVERTADLLDIPELLDRRPGDLSGGQQQRVALGRAIVRDPELFLFDEPLSNLDAKLRIQMRTELNKLHDRVGRTSVYVTHDQAEAMTLGDRVAVMNHGTVQQIDPPQTLYDRPANRFVAGFIGEPPMNFFDVALVERDGGHTVAADGFEVPIPETMASEVRSRASDPDRLIFGVRPEDLSDATATDDDRANATDTRPVIEARVRVVEPMGSYHLLTLTPLGESAEDAEFTAQVSTDSTARVDDRIALAVDVARTHVFDTATGENLTR